MSYRDRPHFVYRLLGRRGRVIYIGCTMDPDRRLKEHRNSARRFHRVEVSEPMDFATARAVEREVIRNESPTTNIEWTPRHMRGLSVPAAARRRS